MLKKYCRGHIGSIYRTNEGYDCKVIDGGSRNRYVTVKIEDWVREISFNQVKAGTVKYPYHPSVCEIGYIGSGKYSTKSNKNAHIKWSSIIIRCYDKKCHENRPTYKSATMSTEWHNFQNFARWFERFYPKDGGKYDIDKDLKMGDSKVYSPQTCIFIPKSLNSFMTNIKLNNTSGRVGVCWHRASDKWIATISTDKEKTKYLGTYCDIEDASRAYRKARAKQVKRWQDFYSFDYPKSILSRLTTMT